MDIVKAVNLALVFTFAFLYRNESNIKTIVTPKKKEWTGFTTKLRNYIILLVPISDVISKIP